MNCQNPTFENDSDIVKANKNANSKKCNVSSPICGKLKIYSLISTHIQNQKHKKKTLAAQFHLGDMAVMYSKEFTFSLAVASSLTPYV